MLSVTCAATILKGLENSYLILYIIDIDIDHIQLKLYYRTLRNSRIGLVPSDDSFRDTLRSSNIKDAKLDKILRIFTSHYEYMFCKKWN